MKFKSIYNSISILNHLNIIQYKTHQYKRIASNKIEFQKEKTKNLDNAIKRIQRFCITSFYCRQFYYKIVYYYNAKQNIVLYINDY